MKFLTLFILLLPIISFSQEYTHQFKGSYYLKRTDKKPVNFTLLWSENNGQVNGEYKDDFYTTLGYATGFTSELGRNITVLFPAPIKGVRTITFLSSEVKEAKKDTIPLSVVTRDLRGNPTSSSTINVTFSNNSQVTRQAQTEGPCVENFGQLEGFCGIYSGMVTEDQDLHNKCNLLMSDAVKLEIGNEGTIQLRLGRDSTIVQVPTHPIGRLPVDPKNTSVDVMSRVCRPLARTEFPTDHCKRVNLVGSFVIERERKHFKGGYLIFDEKTGEACKYGLALDMEQASI